MTTVKEMYTARGGSLLTGGYNVKVSVLEISFSNEINILNVARSIDDDLGNDLTI